jgi:hypothetical protein
MKAPSTEDSLTVRRGQVTIGHNFGNQWISSLDVIGAATGFFANERAPFDTPDYTTMTGIGPAVPGLDDAGGQIDAAAADSGQMNLFTPQLL